MQAQGVGEQLAQVRSIDELHGDEVAAVDFAEVKHRDDVWVGHARRQPRLFEKHLDEVCSHRELRQHALHDDRARDVKPRLPCQVDLGHAAGGDQFLEIKVAVALHAFLASACHPSAVR